MPSLNGDRKRMFIVALLWGAGQLTGDVPVISSVSQIFCMACAFFFVMIAQRYI